MKNHYGDFENIMNNMAEPNKENILHGSNTNIDDIIYGDILNSSYGDGTADILNVIHTDDVISNKELCGEQQTELSMMQVFAAVSSPTLDSDSEEKTTLYSDIIDETPELISLLPDLSRFCEDIESHVINFVSEDMLELNNWDTETENSEAESREKVEMDKGDSFDIAEPIRSSSSSASSRRSSIGQDFHLEENSSSSSSSDDSRLDMDMSVNNRTNKSIFLRQRKQNTIIVSNDEKNERPGDKITKNSSIPIATMTEPKGAKRKWDKTFLCIFCKKSFTKLPRHWYMKHPDEEEVKNIMSFPPNSKEKKKLIAELQNKGIAMSNTYIMKTGEGSVVPKRRPRKGTKLNLKNYIPCRYCKHMFLKTYIDKHERKRCTFNTGSER